MRSSIGILPSGEIHLRRMMRKIRRLSQTGRERVRRHLSDGLGAPSPGQIAPASDCRLTPARRRRRSSLIGSPYRPAADVFGEIMEGSEEQLIDPEEFIRIRGRKLFPSGVQRFFNAFKGTRGAASNGTLLQAGPRYVLLFQRRSSIMLPNYSWRNGG